MPLSIIVKMEENGTLYPVITESTIFFTCNSYEESKENDQIHPAREIDSLHEMNSLKFLRGLPFFQSVDYLLPA